MNTTGDMCVRFWYSLNGPHLERGSLTLYVVAGDSYQRDQVVNYFTISGNKGEDWYEAEVDIKLPNMNSRVIWRMSLYNPHRLTSFFQIGFAAKKGNGYQSDIAVDDVSVTEGTCKGI